MVTRSKYIRWTATWCSVCAWLLLGSVARSQNDPQLRQEQLRARVQKLAADLQDLLPEFERNGLTGDDAGTVKTIAGLLTRLSDQEMQRVIDMLRAPQNTIPAYARQKALIIQMRQLIADYRRRQELEEIAQRLLALADRQQHNLNLASAVTSNVPPDALNAQAIEQDAIGAEVKIVINRIRTFNDKPATPEIAERATRALATINDHRLPAALQTATDTLKAENMPEAAKYERFIRDQLRLLARQLIEPAPRVLGLPQVVADLDELKREQQEITEATNADPGKPGLADEQAALAEKTDQLRQQTSKLTPAADTPLKAAAEQMKQAQQALQSNNPQAAERAEQKAAEDLQQARQALAADNKAVDALLDKLADVIQKEQEVTQPAEQGELARQTEALATEAAHESGEAARDLHEASKDMETAAVAAEHSAQPGQSEPQSPAAAQGQPESGQQPSAQSPATQAARQAALDRLQQAKAALEQAAPGPPNSAATEQALADAQDQLAQAMDQLGQGHPSAAQGLSKAGKAAGKLSAQPRNGLPGAAQKALQRAQQGLAKASQQAATGQPAQALASALAAQAEMAQAQVATWGGGSGNLSGAPKEGRFVPQAGRSGYLELPARDRQAIQQSQGEKYPEEYAPLIEQYLKGLAEQPK